MAGLTRSDYTAMLEEMYLDDRDDYETLVYKDRPALSILEREKTKGGGRYTHIPCRYVNPQGRSATFTDAQGNAAPSAITGFDVTYVSNYGYATVDGDVIDDAGENVELIADALKYEMDGAINNVSDDMASSVFRDVGGSRAQVGSVTTTIITLTNIDEIINFEQNMELVGSANDGTATAHALHNSGASATVTAIDYNVGTLTSDSNWTAQIGSIAANSYLFVEGDFQLKYAGFNSWDPASAPGSTAFYGVDRSVNTRLGGLRYTGTGKPIEEAIMTAGARARRYGAKLDVGFMNPVDWNNLAISLESKSRITRTTVKGSGDAARFGFDAIQVMTGAGAVNIVSDPFCQKSVVWLLQTNTWKLLYSGDDLVRIINHDDRKFMRQTSNDGVEFRIKNRGNLACNAPGHNIRVAI